jgi:tRNA-splicing ligase RtcB (3'-phosphate/5'-hydroxy nucleic acid ligase)
LALPAKDRLPPGLRRIEESIYEIPTSYRPGMRVPGVVFADQALILAATEDKAVEQVVNVAFLPGIVRASMAMPDIHWGYGFPIGGVAATSLEDGVVSPGGVGFDISCGVRLLRSDLGGADIKERMTEIMRELSRNIPKGLGGRSKIKLAPGQMDEVLSEGARWCVDHGYGWPEDTEAIEHGGRYEGADPGLVSFRAKERGLNQLGTVGSGNHFVEVQEVAEVFDREAADLMGLSVGRVTVMIHSGSRGLGHQVCSDYLKEMGRASRDQGIELPDRQLACAYLSSPIGRSYLAAMAAAANFGLANRQALAYLTRQSFESLFGHSAKSLGMGLIYDVSHNVAQIETHEVGQEQKRLCVHRKGATRAFGPGRPEVPSRYRGVGQPVIIPGDMGTASYVLVGTEEAMRRSWGSTCHGAGRVMSRKAALKQSSGKELLAELQAKGVAVAAGSIRGLPEEAPYAYKDVSRVVDVCQRVGLSKKVARLRPLGVLKG